MVMLNGGDLGGTEVDGAGWEIGAVREFSGMLYRRDGDYAVYVGVAA